MLDLAGDPPPESSEDARRSSPGPGEDPWPRPTGHYDVFGQGAWALVCRVGPRRVPLVVCEDRLRMPGLLARRAAGLPVHEETGEAEAR